MEFVDLGQVEFSPAIVSEISSDIARDHRAIPIAAGRAALCVAVDAPIDIEAIDRLHFACGRDLDVRVADPAQITHYLGLLYEQ